MMVGIEQVGLTYLASVAADAADAATAADLVAIGLLPAARSSRRQSAAAAGKVRTGLSWTALALSLGFILALLPAPAARPASPRRPPRLILYRPQRRASGQRRGAGHARLCRPADRRPSGDDGLSLAGNRLPYLDLPPLVRILRELTAVRGPDRPLSREPALPGPWRTRAIAVLAGIAAISVYALAKAPLAIADPPRGSDARFPRNESPSRAALLRRGLGAPHRYRQDIARALLIVALGRFVWFDLAVLCPVLVPQSVGTIPLLNLATLDAALFVAGSGRFAPIAGGVARCSPPSSSRSPRRCARRLTGTS